MEKEPFEDLIIFHCHVSCLGDNCFPIFWWKQKNTISNLSSKLGEFLKKVVESTGFIFIFAQKIGV